MSVEEDAAQAKLAAALWQIDKVVDRYKRKRAGLEPWASAGIATPSVCQDEYALTKD